MVGVKGSSKAKPYLWQKGVCMEGTKKGVKFKIRCLGGICRIELGTHVTDAVTQGLALSHMLRVCSCLMVCIMHR